MLPEVADALACKPLNDIERAMLATGGSMDVDRYIPLRHFFTPGLYIREVFIPKGTKVITKIHKTEHPFVISMGRVSVWTPATGVLHYEAPFTGITRPGTRRLIYAHEDVVWTTFHPTNKTDPAEIEKDNIEPHTAIAFTPEELAELFTPAEIELLQCTP